MPTGVRNGRLNRLAVSSVGAAVSGKVPGKCLPRRFRVAVKIFTGGIDEEYDSVFSTVVVFSRAANEQQWASCRKFVRQAIDGKDSEEGATAASSNSDFILLEFILNCYSRR